MSEKLSLHIVDNGPIKVSGFSSIIYAGEKVEAEGDVYLCRCGETSNSPFCDGTHGKVGFRGEATAKIQEKKQWEGKTIRTFFNPNICMHARYCKPLKELREQELGGDTEAAQKIAETVIACPSGALTYEMKAGPAPVAFENSGEIEIVEGGEVRIKAPFGGGGLEPLEGQPTNRLTLCRCGLSANKPYCDASHHRKKGFK